MTTAAHTPVGTVTTVDPSNGSELAAYEETSDERVDAILDRAKRVAVSWRGVPVTERAEAVRSLGQAMRERGDEHPTGQASTTSRRCLTR